MQHIAARPQMLPAVRPARPSWEEIKGAALASGVALLTAFLVGIVFAQDVLAIIQVQLPMDNLRRDYQPWRVGFASSIVIAQWFTLVLAAPVLLLQFLDLVTPATIPGHRRRTASVVAASTFASAFGMLLAYLMAVPLQVEYLRNWRVGDILIVSRPEAYIHSAVALLCWMSLLCQTPVFVVTAARLGILNRSTLAAWRWYALLLAFVYGAVATPTPDPMNQCIVAAPIYLAFELGLLLARIVPSVERSS